VIDEPETRGGDAFGAKTPDASEQASPATASAPQQRFQELADAELSADSILQAAGGWRGLAESVIPGFAFILIYAFTQDLVMSIAAPAIIMVLLLIVRLIRRETVVPPIAGIAGVALSAFLALRSGNAADFYLPGFWINGGYAIALLISVVVGWPIIGVFAAPLAGFGTAWRDVKPLRRLFTWLTLAWVALFVLRIAVQLPLYFAGLVEPLGIARLIMGAPMYAVLLVATIVLARAGMQKAEDAVAAVRAEQAGERLAAAREQLADEPRDDA